MSESNGNGNGNGTAKQASNNSTAHLAPYQWKPGQSGNPNGRPKNLRYPSELFKDLLADPKFQELVKRRAAEILERGADKETRAMLTEIRKATEGDKLAVTEIEGAEWATNDAEITSPVPPALETNRLPQRGRDS